MGDLIDGLDNTTIARVFPINPKMATMQRSTPSIANLNSGSRNNMIIMILSRRKLHFRFRDHFITIAAPGAGLPGSRFQIVKKNKKLFTHFFKCART